MASSNAPICNINPASPAPFATPITMPSITPATNLPTAIAAINQMSQILNILLGRLAQAESSVTNITNNAGGSAGSKAGGSFKETSVVYKNIKVYDPNDSTVWVTVRRVDKVVWTNSAGQTIVWQRPNTGVGGAACTSPNVSGACSSGACSGFGGL